jgi:hypothetical protein
MKTGGYLFMALILMFLIVSTVGCSKKKQKLSPPHEDIPYDYKDFDLVDQQDKCWEADDTDEAEYRIQLKVLKRKYLTYDSQLLV